MQLLINIVKSHSRNKKKKIDKTCHCSLFSKIQKMQTQETSLQLPTLTETQNSM